MSKRYNKQALKKCKETEEIILLVMSKLKWSRKKVLSWLEIENHSLNKARPIELLDRGESNKIVELLEKRESDRLKCQKKNT